MLSTFDRYLIRRFLHVFAIFFASCMGLFIIIDAFTHVDEFQVRSGEGNGIVGLITRMGTHYLYQTSLFFDLIAPLLAVITVMTVLAMLLRHGELNPVLAAGVPTYRLILPFALGVLCINAMLAVNQELIIPQIADQLQLGHGKNDTTGQRVQPCYDNHLIHIAGERLYAKDRKVASPFITLPFPAISENPTSITADSAVFHKAYGNRPSGWLLTNAKPALEDLSLTETGKNLLRPVKDGSLFLVTDVSLEQLSNAKSSYRYLTTEALLHKIQRPSLVNNSRKSQILNFHSRITRHALNLIGLFLVFPLVIRKESRSPVMNLGFCALVVIGLFGFAEASNALSRIDVIEPELASWLPVITGGGLASWLSAWTRT